MNMTTAHKNKRAEIAADIAAWLATGRRIKEVPSHVMKLEGVKKNGAKPIVYSPQSNQIRGDKKQGGANASRA